MRLTKEASAAASVAARQRISGLIYATPLLPSLKLGDAYGCDLRFKAENFQLTGSFKMRGAAALMTDDGLPPGARLITSSSGNHGIACARAASLTKRSLTVVLPKTVARAKLEKIRAYGVDVVLHGTEAGAAELHAQALAASGGFVYVSPYNDARVIAGQGTIGLELIEQAQGTRIDTVFVAMGGGGLISGVGAVLKTFSPGTRVIGVAAASSAALAASMAAGRVVEMEHLDTLADGVAGGVDEGSVTLALALQVVDEVVTCSEAEIAAALRQLAWQENMVVEGAAALALAGFVRRADELRGRVNVVLLCGANYDRDRILPAILG
ncbi:hypothetical protein FOA52_015934 [Chlamydomonas sp. UWO 241]|nr:hypothetical protein FOA52_015934 [Chlamydomonas sp. UWO 241]